MRIYVTGGAGFIGLAVVRRLVARGDRVTATIRDPTKAGPLRDLGADIRVGDLSRTATIVEAMRGADTAIHIAGDYRVGIPASERPAMLDSNVGTTTRVLDAAETVGLERLVAISTVNVFGDTHGRIVDEKYRRDLADGFLSAYDETKFLSHRAVEERIAAGKPIVIAQPGVTYGPGDHTALGSLLRDAYLGKLRYLVLGQTGISPAHVDDVAGGNVGALDRGRIGESYVLAGQNLRLHDALLVSARAGGRRLPRLRIPDALMRSAAVIPGGVAKLAGLPENLAEVIRSSDGVTFWASSAKAAAELGYRPRDLASGVRAAFGGD
jgi:nucleoside-diphosphate-sugar epimerase